MILATSKVLHALGAKPRDRISSRIALRSSSLSALRQIAAVSRPRAMRKCGYDKITPILEYFKEIKRSIGSRDRALKVAVVAHQDGSHRFCFPSIAASAALRLERSDIIIILSLA